MGSACGENGRRSPDNESRCIPRKKRKTAIEMECVKRCVGNAVVVVNLYSHSECMQHVSRNHVRTGKQPKNIK